MREEETLSGGIRRWHLVVLCLVLWLPGFFSLPPGDRDESRFAQATKQMVQSGDFVRIMNGTQPRNRKPIGIYWLQAPFVEAAGDGLANPIWPYRMPSLLGGIIAVLAVFEAALALTGDRRIAGLGAAMLACCVILTVETHIAKTDAALLGTTTIAMAVLAAAWMGRPVARWQAGVFWLAMGAGILIKGPITPMVAGLAAATLCVWERRAGWLRALRAGWGVPLMLAVVLPWFLAIGVATGGRFLSDAVGGDLGSKLAGGSETHGGFPGLHLLLMPLLAFPASLPVIMALPAAWQARREAAVRFLIAWAVPSWMVFEAVPTKLPHYTLPLYPALFLAASWFVVRGWRPAGLWTESRWALGVGRLGLVAAGCVIGAGALALPVAMHAAWWLGVPGALAAGVVAWFAWQRRVAWAVAAAVPMYAAVLQGELPAIPALWIAPRVEAALRADWPQWNAQGRGLAVAGYAEPSLMFLAGTDILQLPDGASGAQALARGRASLVLVTDRDLAPFEAVCRELGVAARDVAQVGGFNVSRGRWVVLNVMVK
jgi:4-amino-4-deoxy-L-arabinose transferase-like glycosyltransferase